MGSLMFQKIVISFVIFTVLIAGCTTGPAPSKSTLQLSSSPSGAEVYLDNQFHGTTPGTITDVGLGNHTLEYRHPGYLSWRSTITVTSGSSSYFAALIPTGTQPYPVGSVTTLPLSSAPGVTVQVEKGLMIIGNSQAVLRNRFSKRERLSHAVWPG